MKIVTSNTFRSIIIFIAGAIAATLLVAHSFFRENRQENNENKRDSTFADQRFYLPEVPDEMTFAGEKVPLEH